MPDGHTHGHVLFTVAAVFEFVFLRALYDECLTTKHNYLAVTGFLVDSAKVECRCLHDRCGWDFVVLGLTLEGLKAAER